MIGHLNNTGPRTNRLRRLYRHTTYGLLVTPLDHSLADGPVTPAGRSLDGLVADLALGGSDAVVLHKGAIRALHPDRFVDVALIVHLNGSTALAPDPDAKVMLTAAEEAIRLGADAVSVHVNLGSATEVQQLTDLARVATECDHWNLPLLAMIYPRGPRVTNPYDPDLVMRALTTGVELGADLVKTVQLPDPTELRDVVARCPVPVLVAGGPPRPDQELLSDVARAMAAGVGGVAMGRCLFSAPDPRKTTAKVAALVHQRPGLVSTRPTEKEERNHVDDQAVLA